VREAVLQRFVREDMQTAELRYAIQRDDLCRSSVRWASREDP
jgi:hypothetical protein